MHDTGELAEQIYGFDAVISAFSGRTQTDAYDYYVSGVKSIIHGPYWYLFQWARQKGYNAADYIWRRGVSGQ